MPVTSETCPLPLDYSSLSFYYICFSNYHYSYNNCLLFCATETASAAKSGGDGVALAAVPRNLEPRRRPCSPACQPPTPYCLGRCVFPGHPANMCLGGTCSSTPFFLNIPNFIEAKPAKPGSGQFLSKEEKIFRQQRHPQW